jgi:hypothetical protein
MDAVVPQDVRCVAYGQAVWSCPANAGDKLVEMRCRPNGRHAEIDRRRWQQAGSPGRSRSSRKPIAQGVPE